MHYDLDCLIFASGFEVGTEYTRRAGFETVGRGGETLSRALGGRHADPARHPRARLPEPVHRRPRRRARNLISNITHNLAEAGTTIAAVVAHALDVGAEQVEVTDGGRAGVGRAASRARRRRFLGNPDCTPGYYNNEGRPIGRREKLNAGGYPGGPVAYFQYIDAWRKSGTFAGLTFGTAAVPAARAG